MNLKNNKTRMDKRSIYLRKIIVRGLEGGLRGHIGSSMSIVEILRVLYDKIMHHSPKNINNSKRDRLILSKGHGCLALYAILADKGYIDIKELDSFCHSNSRLGGHPDIEIPGVEITSGSLGHGPSIAIGILLASKIKKIKINVYTIVGDGELGEGSVWESMMYADKYKLDNFYLLIDYNKIQTYGKVSEVSGVTNLKSKFKSFGFNVGVVDGHNINEIENAIKKQKKVFGKPHALICNTVKGKGIIFAENQLEWHHKSSLSTTEISNMYKSLEEYKK